MTVQKTSGVEKKRKYFAHGNYEKLIENGMTRELHYIAVGTGLVAIFQKKAAGDSMFYVHTDHLGSLNVITNLNGAIKEELSFDAWGRRRNPANWTFTGVSSTYSFDRGYTGHEHLAQFGLINMNGLVYDPLLGRFLSPDIVVQNTTYTQSYNRYSYCLGNPLKYKDPSGYYYAPCPNNDPEVGSYYGINPLRHIGGGSNLTRLDVNYSAPNYYYYDGNSYRGIDGQVVTWDEVNSEYFSIGFQGEGALEAATSMVSGNWDLYSVNAYGKVNYVLAPAGENYGLQYLLSSHPEGTNAGITDITALSYGDISNYYILGGSASGGGDGFNWGILIGAAGTSISAGTEYVDNLIRTSYKTGRNPVSWSKLTPKQQAWRTANVLGKNAKYVKYAKGAGVVGTGISIGMAGYDIASGQGTTIDYFDVGIGTASIGAAIFLASNPVGWVIGAGAAVYFAGRLVYDIYEEVND